MRVISMVPSWTETLLRLPKISGFELVGRTRFCIHPEEKVKGIAIVGGTKTIDWEIVRSLQPDLIIMDREENPKHMADDCPFGFLATHVTSLDSLEGELNKLSEALPSEELALLGPRTQRAREAISKQNSRWISSQALARLRDLTDLSLEPANMNTLLVTEPLEVNCLIWKDPWMTVSGQTFMGSMLRELKLKNRFETHVEKYPKIEISDLAQGVNLFTTEPYPFHKKQEVLKKLNLSGIFVDGEVLSWFGIRAIEFLEGLLPK